MVPSTTPPLLQPFQIRCEWLLTPWSQSMTGHGLLLLSHSGFVSIYDIKKLISGQIIESPKGRVCAHLCPSMFFFFFGRVLLLREFVEKYYLQIWKTVLALLFLFSFSSLLWHYFPLVSNILEFTVSSVHLQSCAYNENKEKLVQTIINKGVYVYH